MKYNNLPPVALAGFFSWLKRTVNNVLNAISEVSHNPFFVLTMIEDAFDGDGAFNLGNSNPGEYLFRGGSAQEEINLTIQEQAALDQWVETRFKPIFLTYFSELKVFSSTTIRLSEFRDYYNDAHEFIAYLKWYITRDVSSTYDPALSINARLARNQFLEIQLEILKTDIMSFVDSTRLSFTTEIIESAIITNKYSALGFSNVPQSINTQVRKIKDNSFVDSSTNTNLEEDTEVVYTPIETVKKKSSLGTILVLGLIGAAVLYSFNNTSENELAEK
ncbi:hypothetical protein ACPX19_01395 [Winogradskyella sp. HB-48]|uniref:hypothetical protein n=1 Tax=Winogradskyella sp. HB-48 TaxID=3416808 RepID=UPI003CF41008